MNERPEWRPLDTLRSMRAVVTVLGGAALDLVVNRGIKIQPIYGDYPRYSPETVEAPHMSEEELDGQLPLWEN